MGITKHLKKKFFTGLIILMPVLVTTYITYLIISSADAIISPIVKNVAFQVVGREVYVPGAGFFLFLIIVYATGVLASNFMGKRLLLYGEQILRKIPFVKGIYSSVKDMTTAFSAEKAEAFQGVALAEFPSAGTYALGFITRRTCTTEGRNYCSIFIPTTPNPTSGFLLMVEEKNLICLDMAVDDALKYIVSLGTTGIDLKWTGRSSFSS